MVDVPLQTCSLIVALVLFAMGLIKLVAQQSLIASVTGCMIMCLSVLLAITFCEQSLTQSWSVSISLLSFVLIIAVVLFQIYWIASLSRLRDLPPEQAWHLNAWRELQEIPDQQSTAQSHSSDEKDPN